jgi:hypothetical protein
MYGDTLGSDANIDTSEPHWLLMVAEMVHDPGGIVLRKSRHDEGAYERVGLIHGEGR